jgi:hypothetical protein
MEVIKMTGFEFAKTFATTEEKMIVLFTGVAKKAYAMAGKDFDSLPIEERKEIVLSLMRKAN